MCDRRVASFPCASHATLEVRHVRKPRTSPVRAGVGFKPAHFRDILAAHSRSASSRCTRRTICAPAVPCMRNSVNCASATRCRFTASACRSARCDRPTGITSRGLSCCAIAMSPKAFPNIWPGRRTTVSTSTTSCRCPTRRRRWRAWRSTSTWCRRHWDVRCCSKIRPPTWALPKAQFRRSHFLAEVSTRTGCGLLLDVNNVFVSSVNHGTSPRRYLDAFPFDRVKEIHLGGHDEDADDDGAPLLIDAHGSPVAGGGLGAL